MRDHSQSLRIHEAHFFSILKLIYSEKTIQFKEIFLLVSILQKPRPKHRLSMFSTVQKHCLAMLHCGWPIIRKAGAPVLPKNLHGLGLSDIKTKKNISSNMCGHLRKPELYDNIFLIFLRSVWVGTERLLTAKAYILQKILFQCLA